MDRGSDETRILVWEDKSDWAIASGHFALFTCD